MNNNDIRQRIKSNRLYFYEIAEEIGITEFTLSRWFRKELTPEQQEKVLAAIDKLRIKTYAADK